ncbi:MarC family protein [Ichthyobacterium seriolicida]|uniref:UPF0056 membrane protein n=1 Tax=Ichthyobacterium seriolicida TaxID=242600 RepID=A0A1J1E9D3_9FLAO|nr:MarC family protein [Ichthyobacterium seriolicida]BAV94515.1 multiple antibiotic resistance protein marC [Ichthyobacterium seriolicida]
MNFDLKQVVTCMMVLFAVIDIIGNVPIIIDLRKKAGRIHSGRASLIAGVIMVVFLFLGESLLGLIGINTSSFAVAGSLVIFFMALEMILGIQIYREENSPDTVSIVPIAFPLIAGPGSMTSLLSLRSEYYVENIILGLIINIIFVYIVLKTSEKIERVLGSAGINVIRKVFGIILLAISVKLFTSNIGNLLG